MQRVWVTWADFGENGATILAVTEKQLPRDEVLKLEKQVQTTRSGYKGIYLTGVDTVLQLVRDDDETSADRGDEYDGNDSDAEVSH